LKPSLWAILFLVVFFVSLAGIGASIPNNFALGFVSTFAFLIALLGLTITGVVYLFRWIQFGRRQGYGTPTVTKLGEVVRSNSERKIADYFASNGVRYEYEKPAMNRWGFKRISRPDFYLPDYGVYVEYWGLVNLPNNSARRRYERTLRWKMAQYHKNGIKFISLYPSDLDRLDAAFRSKLEAVSGGRVPNYQVKYCSKCGSPVAAPGKFCTKCGFAVALPMY
jgi:hypothetical protein